MDMIEKYFGLKPQSTIQDGMWTRYVIDDFLYTLVPVTNIEQETLIELYEMSEHMAKYGDRRVSTFVAGLDQKYLITHKEQDYVLLKNKYIKASSRKNNTGRMLAIFHERGKVIRSIPTTVSRMGQWKEYWVKRLEQLEQVWHSTVSERSDEEFEQLFVESFPYYLGVCENAIQYVTDTEMDLGGQMVERGTICHAQFREDIWDGPIKIRSPFDWVYDHQSRDIAEWIRDCYFKNSRSFQPMLNEFLQGYQSIDPLSDVSWRFIYARLLFPLHYFSCVEEYFTGNSRWTKTELVTNLRKYIRDSTDHELFLKHFYQLAGTKQYPILDWLQQEKRKALVQRRQA